jgi:hypothetical protein
VLFSAGFPPTNTVGQPGIHGAGAFGTQGMGVSTPSAAAVADATVGLAGLEHIPNVGNTLSIIVAASCPHTSVFCWDVTISVAGAAPKEHMHTAVATVLLAIFSNLPFCYGIT